MTARWPVVVAWLFPPVALALVIVSLFVGENTGTAAAVAGSAIPLSFALAGAVIASSRPSNGIGWFLCGFSLNIPAEGISVGMVERGFEGPLVVWGAWAAAWMWAPGLVGLVTYLPLSFPHGRLPGRHHKAILALGACGAAAIAVGNALDPTVLEPLANPTAVHGYDAVLEALTDFGVIPVALAMLASVVAATARFRRSTGAERQQLKWFVSAILLVIVGAVANGVLYESGNVAAGQIAIGCGLVWLPIALGVGILRHGLFDIDRIISRTVSYTLLTLLLLAVYLAAVTLLTAVTAPVTGDSPLAVAAATLLAAAAFGPARGRIQLAVDRRFNRAGYDAARTAADYRARLRDQLDLDTIGEDLIGTARTAVQPSTAVLWLRASESSS